MASRTKRDSSARSVLLVTADETLRDAFSMLLRSQGYSVRGVETAETLGTAGAPAPGVVLLDQLGSDGEGHAFVQQVRARPEWARIPFVLLGGEAHGGRVTQGIDAVFPAPIDLGGVLDVVQRCLTDHP